ncbi:MAG: BBP7 family outer membrane beta-barrel protein [Pirellulaceae bacterium]|nr:BBP7 family outer membrane beta-barrel protein [Pirellulaceae bacterium]
MSVLNLFKRLVAVVAFMAFSPSVFGQVYHPFAEPLEFNPDWQFFAPVDVDSLAELPNRKRANTGWFGTYDRTYLWMSRPNISQSEANGDFGWGNRYDLGFMTDDRSGWLFSMRHLGVNSYDEQEQERINRVNTADTGAQPNPITPFLDQNDPQYRTRLYVLSNSLNVASMSNFEINKTWRREPYRYGGIIEPMVGLRYTSFEDRAQNQTYGRSGNLISAPGTVSATNVVETFVSDETNIQNRMVGGQLGFRYFNYYKRWTLSSELRTFGLQNFQNRTYRQRSETTEYAGVAINSAVVATDYLVGGRIDSERTSNNEFVVGFEARAEAAYQVTKYFSVRGGVDVINFARGIWRGANPGFGTVNDHDQDVQLAGFTFGLTLNR